LLLPHAQKSNKSTLDSKSIAGKIMKSEIFLRKVGAGYGAGTKSKSRCPVGGGKARVEKNIQLFIRNLSELNI